MMKPRAISVFSGGLDSTVATSYLKDKYDIHALTFDYGQRSARMEIKSAKAICEKLNMKHTIMELPWLSNLGKSALTSDEKVPELRLDQLDSKEICNDTARKVWVPGRNLVFTAIANSFSEAYSAEAIIVGWDHEEAATFLDNSKEFLNSFNELLKVGSIYNTKIEAPLIDKNKKEIVQLGVEINAPLNLSYSCYMGEEEPCGICESCMRRKRAFQSAGVSDGV